MLCATHPTPGVYTTLEATGLTAPGVSVREVYEQAFETCRQETVKRDWWYRVRLMELWKAADPELTRISIIPEFRIGNSIADILAVGPNGDITAIEIKSGHDTLERLANQLNDYTRMAPRTMIITSPAMATSVLAATGMNTGVAILDGADGDDGDDGQLVILRAPQRDTSQLEPRLIADMLRRGEAEQALTWAHQRVPHGPNTRIRTLLANSFERGLTAKQASYAAGTALYTMRSSARLNPFLNTLPDCLIPAALDQQPSPTQQQRMNERLNMDSTAFIQWGQHDHAWSEPER